MIRLTYISTARPGIDEAGIATILAASRRNNHRDGLTGLLVFDGVRFLQALEGDEDAAAATFARIKADPRHRACVELGRAPIAARGFGDWDMAWRRIVGGDAGASLADTVSRLVAQMPDANVRATFDSFARIARPAA